MSRYIALRLFIDLTPFGNNNSPFPLLREGGQGDRLLNNLIVGNRLDSKSVPLLIISSLNLMGTSTTSRISSEVAAKNTNCQV